MVMQPHVSLFEYFQCALRWCVFYIVENLFEASDDSYSAWYIY